jgi:hypothetical protein
MLKVVGYGISTLSVILLGAVAWKGAQDDPMMVAALILGMGFSIIGMGLRLASHLREKNARPERPR